MAHPVPAGQDRRPSSLRSPEPLRVLPDEGKPFSIVDWMTMNTTPGSILFITSNHTDLTLNRALLTLWMDLAVNTTREELRYVQSYEKGQVLEVARGMPDIGLGRGRYTVLGVDAKDRVEIQVGSKVRRFDPQKIDPKDKRDALGLAKPEQLRLHEGDRIKWTMNDKDRGLLNSEMAQVLAVGPDGVIVETASKTVVELKAGDPMLERIGLAYALNMHMAQGMTADNGIGVMASGERNLSNQRLFNVMVTRTRDALVLFTDNKDGLARQLESSTGNKSSALETVGSVEIDKERASEPSKGGNGIRKELIPSMPAEASKPRVHSLRTGLSPEARLPLPEKTLELGL